MVPASEVIVTLLDPFHHEWEERHPASYASKLQNSRSRFFLELLQAHMCHACASKLPTIGIGRAECD